MSYWRSVYLHFGCVIGIRINFVLLLAKGYSGIELISRDVKDRELLLLEHIPYAIHENYYYYDYDGDDGMGIW